MKRFADFPLMHDVVGPSCAFEYLLYLAEAVQEKRGRLQCQCYAEVTSQTLIQDRRFDEIYHDS
jgi:hypothetical protein